MNAWRRTALGRFSLVASDGRELGEIVSELGHGEAPQWRARALRGGRPQMAYEVFKILATAKKWVERMVSGERPHLRVGPCIDVAACGARGVNLKYTPFPAKACEACRAKRATRDRAADQKRFAATMRGMARQ